MNLSIENLIDIRESVTRRLRELADLEDRGRAPESRREIDRRTRSLTEAKDVVEQEIKDLQFEAEQSSAHRERDEIYRC